MEKKDLYRQTLPSYPGKAWMVTLCLWNAVPPGALSNYTNRLKELQWKIDYRKKHQQYDRMLKELENKYSQVRRYYFNAFDRRLAQQTDQAINLCQPGITSIILEVLSFWAASHIENYAWCIMPNHVHWVFRTREKDHRGKPVSLPEIIESVKNDTAQQINTLLERQGPLWHPDNFDLLLKNDKQLHRAIEFTLNNPIVAKLVNAPNQWPGSWGSGTL